MSKNIIATESAPAAIGPYSQGVTAGGFLFTAMQIALEPESGEVTGATAAEQVRQCLRNIAAVVAASGGVDADFVGPPAPTQWIEGPPQIIDEQPRLEDDLFGPPAPELAEGGGPAPTAAAVDTAPAAIGTDRKFIGTLRQCLRTPRPPESIRLTVLHQNL